MKQPKRGRPLDPDDMFEERDVVMASEMTGAIPAQLTEEEHAQIYSKVFNLTQQQPYNQD